MSPKQRFLVMVVVDAICVALALIAIVAYAGRHQPYGLPLFAGAILVGFAAQIWFIVGLARSTRLAKRL
jgi:hypothetical protein